MVVPGYFRRRFAGFAGMEPVEVRMLMRSVRRRNLGAYAAMVGASVTVGLLVALLGLVATVWFLEFLNLGMSDLPRPVSRGAALLLLAIAPVFSTLLVIKMQDAWYVSQLRAFADRSTCLSCGYSLSGLGENATCPECGMMHRWIAWRGDSAWSTQA
jgi:hypothetical protein